MSSSPQPTQDVVPANDASYLGRFDKPFRDHARLIAATVVTLGFCWRLWMAQATFFNTDEAWHFSMANQDSLRAAYDASLKLAHPPLLVFILYFWRHLGTSDVMLRFPGVLAGAAFCWIFYKWLARVFGDAAAWCGLIFAAFLPPMIALSAELRQYSLMLMFAVSAAYFLERALADDSVRMMLLSSACLYLAMLSHYSAFLFAASLGGYAILRMVKQRPPAAAATSWIVGQGAGLGLAWLLYTTHISRLGQVYPVAQPLRRFGDFYISDWYFHPDREHYLYFLYRGTFGVFRFFFGQTAVGQIAALLFLAGVAVLLFGHKLIPETSAPVRLAAVLLMSPFVLNWIAVAAGLYPYGRTRQCVFLAIFGLSGISVALTNIGKDHVAPAVGIALGLVAICQVFGTLQGRDMLPLAEQRREHMDEALQFIRSEVSPSDLLLTDKATSFQMRHYLCHKKPVTTEPLQNGLELFRCEGFRVVSTGPNDGALTADNLEERWQNGRPLGDLAPGSQVWVVQAGWASGLGEALRREFPEFARLEVHSFGRYIEIFKLPPRTAPQSPPQR